MSSSSNILKLLCSSLQPERNRRRERKERVGFFNFPKDPNLRAGTKFKLTEITNVWSLHFRESEIKNGLGGRKMRVDVHHHSYFEICMAHFTAVTKSGTGTWDLGREDAGTRDAGPDGGTRGSGDAGTRGRV